MPRIFLPFVLSIILCGSFPIGTSGQDCAPPPVTVNARTYNIFSPEQEMVLGDLTFQRMSGDLRFIRDPQLVSYVNRIGERLIRHLPQTGLKFQFFIIDLPEANAFNIPGGYVFVSRKLIALTNSEDELAGVIAHELGHAVVHHAASDFSDLLKKILNVTQLGDRKDVAEKYNLLIEKRRTKRVSQSSNHESEEQLEADRIGVFSMLAAGYDPGAFAAFFDRLVETKGKTGSWFSDIFGKAKPEQKRLREMIKATEQFPAACRERRQATVSQVFLKWQADVVSARELRRQEELTALLWRKELSPKLRSDVSHLAFSRDGKYFLAQDDFGIAVVQREPLQLVCQIPAPQAQEAHFTPDGQFVVFGTEDLRYEKWSLAERKPVEIRELVIRSECWEHKFSPDGKYLACVDNKNDLNILDTQSGKKIWEKKDFYILQFWEYWGLIFGEASGEQAAKDQPFFHFAFSPDSRLVAVSRSNQHRAYYFDSDMTDDTLLALDLSTLKPVSVGGELKRVTRRSFVFLDSTRILGMPSQKSEESGIFSFPEGKRLEKFTLGANELKPTANPDYVIVKSLGNDKVGVFDVSRKAVVVAMKKADATIWNDLIIFESASGTVRISDFRYDDEKKQFQPKEVGSIELPVSFIGQLQAAEVSDNFEWLTISSKTRGGLWNLSSGERKIFVRGFRGAALGNDGGGIADFPKLESVNHSLVVLNPQANAIQALREVPEKGTKQHGRFVLIRQSLKSAKKQEKEKEESERKGQESDEVSLAREVKIELRDVVSDKVIWSREFPKEAPGLFFDEFSGRLIFYWTLWSEVGKARLKEEATLAARAKELGNKVDDYLLEVFDAFAGKTVGTMLIETGQGSFGIESGLSEGDWLVLHDSNNRVLIFSIKDGTLRHRFFGAHAAINPAGNQVVVENYPGELTFYSLTSGDSLARLVFSSDAAFVRFSLDGKKLFVLASDQTAYAFDLEKLKPKVEPTAQ